MDTLNSRTDSTPTIPPPVARRAVQWLLELQSGSSNEPTRQALHNWLAEHPDHQRAWQRIETVNNKLRPLTSQAGSAAAHAALTAASGLVNRRDAIKTLAVLLFAGGTAWGIKDQTPWREWVADARTGVGQRRTLRLADGTRLALNSDSAVNVHFTDSERRIHLISGEILVTTGMDGGRKRPFTVATAQGELQPLGTRFLVRQLDAVSRVGVFEGAVAIRPRDALAVTYTLHAGEQARFTRTVMDGPTPVNDTATAWTDGMLVASGMRLADFLAELSRHRPGYLGCDSTIAGLRVSGTYPLADTDRILDTLRTTLPVEIHFRTRYWVTVRGAKG